MGRTAASGRTVGSSRAVATGRTAASGRRPSTIRPYDLANLAVWLRADLSNSLRTTSVGGIAVANDGDAVGAWQDLSGNGRPLIQATGSKDPLWKTGIQNGLPVVRFDGVDDVLRVASFSLVQPWTMLMVLKIRTDVNGARIFDGTTLNTGACFITAAGTGTIGLFAGLNGPTALVGTAAYKAISAVFNGSSSTLRVNGGAATTGNASTGSPGGITLAANASLGAPGTIDVAEAIVYSAALTSAQEDTVFNYLNARWNLF